MEIKIRKNDEIYIIDVEGDIDLYSEKKLRDLIPKMIEKQVKYFIINLENVDYIDSTGIGALLSISNALKKLDLWLAITNLHGSVKKVIELTKLTTYFPLVNTVEEALEQLIG